MKNKLKQLFSTKGQSQFKVNFIRVAQANVFSQIILLAAMPFITRLYSPEHFGVAALFTTAIQLFGSFCTWRFDKMIPNARSNAAASALLSTGLAVLLIICLLATVIIVFFREQLNMINAANLLADSLIFLPLALAGTGLQHVYRAWYARDTDLTAVSNSRIFQNTSYIFLALILGYFSFGTKGLVLAATLSIWVGFWVLFKNEKWLSKLLKKLNLKRVKAASLPHTGQASWASVVSLINTISLTAPVFILSQYYSAIEIGWYALMYRLVTAPLGTITNALSISFWSRSAELVRQNNLDQLRTLYLSVTKKMLIPAAAVLLFCVFASPFVGLVFGDEWAGAGTVLQAISPMLIGYTLFSATNHLIVLRHQEYQLIADGLRLVLMLLSTLLAQSLNWDFHWAVFGIALSSLVGHFSLFLINLFAHKKLKQTNSKVAH